jgi:hypothetical protein
MQGNNGSRNVGITLHHNRNIIIHTVLYRKPQLKRRWYDHLELYVDFHQASRRNKFQFHSKFRNIFSVAREHSMVLFMEAFQYIWSVIPFENSSCQLDTMMMLAVRWLALCKNTIVILFKLTASQLEFVWKVLLVPYFLLFWIFDSFGLILQQPDSIRGIWAASSLDCSLLTHDLHSPAKNLPCPSSLRSKQASVNKALALWRMKPTSARRSTRRS